MTDDQLAESVIAGLVAHFEFTCYCGRDHYAGDGYVAGIWSQSRRCACGRGWQLVGTTTWNSWWLVDKANRRRPLFGKRRRDPHNLAPVHNDR